MPPKHKNKSATPRDRRHENGLAPPVKQVKKQKSDTLLNGHAARPAPSSSDTLSTLGNDPRLDDATTIDDFAASNTMAAHRTQMFAATFEHSSIAATNNRTIASPLGLASAEVPGSGAPSYQDTADATSGRSPGPLKTDPPTTVVAPLSPLDVIAILLVLMQLPYSVLAIIHVCFAFLTFGSPPTGWSLASIFSATDWLQSHGGSPSIVTMLVVDLLFFGFWCLLPLGKDFTLDLAQAAVAISLGGGTSGGSGRTQGVVCFGIVAIHHMLGQKLWNTRHYTVAWFCGLLNMVTANTTFGPWDPDDILDVLDVCPDTDRSWPRTLLELHIVTQGVVRIVRRWFIRPSIQKFAARRGESDPAYIPPSSPTASSSATHQDGGRNTSSDGRHPGPSPALREGVREKSVSVAKKKRKQATFVRSQQPFWAAIANTKVTVTKEIEQTQASQDLFEAGIVGVEKLGSSTNRCTNCCVWITDVKDTEIRFTALCLEDTIQPESNIQDSPPSETDEAGLYARPSIVVQINGAEWASTTIVHDGTRDNSTLLKGKIFGLTSLTNYQVQFLLAKDQSPVQSFKLVTRPDTSLDQAHPEGPFRPSSPTSTLQKSIGAAESSLTEHRNRSKKNKRDHRSSFNMLKKEIDSVETRVQSCGGYDERQRQKQFQYRQNIKQAEDSFANIADEIEHAGEVPDGERQAATDRKDTWSTQKKSHSSIRSEMEATKSNMSRQVSTARTETSQLQQKQERITARLQKLNAQREGLVAANEQDDQDQKRRDQVRMSELKKVANEKRKMQMHVQSVDNQRLNIFEQCATMEQQLQVLDGNLGLAMPGDAGVPPTPEGTYSSPVYQSNRLPQAFAAGNAVQPPIGTPPAHSRRGSLLKQNRVRSSSMLSNVSGFTDDEIRANYAPNGVNAGGGKGHLGHDGSPVAASGTQPRPGPIGAERDRNSPRNMKG